MNLHTHTLCLKIKQPFCNKELVCASFSCWTCVSAYWSLPINHNFNRKKYCWGLMPKCQDYRLEHLLFLTFWKMESYLLISDLSKTIPNIPPKHSSQFLKDGQRGSVISFVFSILLNSSRSGHSDSFRVSRSVDFNPGCVLESPKIALKLPMLEPLHRPAESAQQGISFLSTPR